MEYKTSFSYSGLQREAIIEHLMSLFNGTEKLATDQVIYEPLLNMTKAEREKYIEYVLITCFRFKLKGFFGPSLSGPARVLSASVIIFL